MTDESSTWSSDGESPSPVMKIYPWYYKSCARNKCQRFPNSICGSDAIAIAYISDKHDDTP